MGHLAISFARPRPTGKWDNRCLRSSCRWFSRKIPVTPSRSMKRFAHLKPESFFRPGTF